MGKIENEWRDGMSRRKALAGLAGIVAASPLLHAQLDPRPLTQHRRTPGLAEMMTAFDFEPVMFSNIPLATYDNTARPTATAANSICAAIGRRSIGSISFRGSRPIRRR